MDSGEGRGRDLGDLENLASRLAPLANVTRLELLRFLTTPHYLEEIAAHLKVTRQAARKHLDRLVKIGVIERKPGVRARGPVTEYVINTQALFLIHDEFEKLGSLRRDADQDVLHRTLAHNGTTGAPVAHVGPSLTIVRGLDTGLRYSLDGADGSWILGRDERCGIPIPSDPYASNRHAEVSRERDRYVLTDLSSTNGTRLNWRSLARGGDATLRHGDVVGVGKTLLLFRDDP